MSHTVSSPHPPPFPWGDLWRSVGSIRGLLWCSLHVDAGSWRDWSLLVSVWAGNMSCIAWTGTWRRNWGTASWLLHPMGAPLVSHPSATACFGTMGWTQGPCFLGASLLSGSCWPMLPTLTPLYWDFFFFSPEMFLIVVLVRPATCGMGLWN